MMSDTKFALVLIGSIVGLIVGPATLLDQFIAYQCRSYQRSTGLATKYVNFDSCYVQTARGWQRWDEYIARAITNDGDRP